MKTIFSTYPIRLRTRLLLRKQVTGLYRFPE